MKYNLLAREENTGIFENVIGTVNGKLIIASDNSFVISSIIEELKPAANRGEFELYSGDTKVNLDVKSDVCIVAVCTNNLQRLQLSSIDESFSVAIFSRATRDSFCFDIDIKQITECIEFSNAIITKGKVNTASNNIDYETEIINNLRVHNVVFVQDLNNNFVKFVKSKRGDITVFNNIDMCSGEHIIAENYGGVVVKFDAPEHHTIEYYDCINFMAMALKYGVIIICNTTWVKFFLELTSIQDNVSLSSIVMYNSPNYGSMGNQSLYSLEHE